MDKTLLEKLKDVGKNYGTYHELYLLCRDAAKRIEEQYKEIKEIGEENIRLEAEVKGFKELLGTYDTILKGRNEEVARLQAELDNLALASHSDKDVAIRNDELRDQFACAALQGILARMESTGSEEFIAKQAYKQANEMLQVNAILKARERK